MVLTNESATEILESDKSGMLSWEKRKREIGKYYGNGIQSGDKFGNGSGIR